jgi:hypothetical protein
MVYHACILCCGMNLDHCMYVFHASLLIKCYQSFQINQEMRSWCGMPSCGRLGMLQCGVSYPMGGGDITNWYQSLWFKHQTVTGQNKCESRIFIVTYLYICV